jgi:hypothetical protein
MNKINRGEPKQTGPGKKHAIRAHDTMSVSKGRLQNRKSATQHNAVHTNRGCGRWGRGRSRGQLRLATYKTDTHDMSDTHSPRCGIGSGVGASWKQHGRHA